MLIRDLLRLSDSRHIRVSTTSDSGKTILLDLYEDDLWNHQHDLILQREVGNEQVTVMNEDGVGILLVTI